MSAMPRIKGKATKIAEKILGIPLTAKRKRRKQSKTHSRLLSEEVRYVK